MALISKSFDIKLDGQRQLAKAFSTLSGKAARRVLRKSLNFGATPVLKTARSLVPKETGTLRRALTKKTFLERGRNVIVTLVGIRQGYTESHPRVIKKPGGKRYVGKTVTFEPEDYAVAVEIGSKRQKTASLFLRRAFLIEQFRALTRIAHKAKQEIAAEVRKLPKA